MWPQSCRSPFYWPDRRFSFVTAFSDKNKVMSFQIWRQPRSDIFATLLITLCVSPSFLLRRGVYCGRRAASPFYSIFTHKCLAISYPLNLLTCLFPSTQEWGFFIASSITWSQLCVYIHPIICYEISWLLPNIRRMPCPVIVRSGITSKNYEDVIGKLKIGSNSREEKKKWKDKKIYQ